MEMERKAKITGNCRWWLKRKWSDGSKIICWIMLNPSTADAEQDDPTLRRIIGFSKKWGFDSLLAVNLYPFRTPSSKECRRIVEDWDIRGDWDRRDSMIQNLVHVDVCTKISDKVVIGWGNGADWDKNWPELLVEESNVEQFYCLGTTKNGNPKHPLYVKADTELVPWT